MPSIAVCLFLSLSFLFVSTYTITCIQSILALRHKGNGKAPPLIPYLVPGVGNTTGFASDIAGFMAKATKAFGYPTPVTVSLIGNQRIHLVSNAEYIATMLSLKTSKTLTMKNSVLLAMGTVFGAPAHIMRIWAADSSGINTVPLAGSTVKPQNRVFMNSHKSSLKYLSGTNLKFLSERFMSKFNQLLRDKSTINHDSFVEIEDLYAFLQNEMFYTVMEALCGPHMLRLNPSLAEDFWAFDAAAPELFQGLPRWMNPSGYAKRDKMLANIKNWHAFAKDHVDLSAAAGEGPDEDEYFGTKWLRNRAIDHSKVEGFDPDACAADDLGLLFAANGNAIPAAFWVLYYILRTPSLTNRVRAEIKTCQIAESGEYTLTDLTSNPLLSSVYAETLRLRNASLVTRTPIEKSFPMDPWAIRQGELIGMSNWVTCRNEELWSTGPPGTRYPLDEFYAERFLVDPNVPGSGPAKRDYTNEKAVEVGEEAKFGAEARFSLEGVTGGWIPYGGGATVCPGRHFAKMEILGSVATLLKKYDIELIGDGKVEPDMKYMMLGMLPPKTKIAAKIRLRSE